MTKHQRRPGRHLLRGRFGSVAGAGCAPRARVRDPAAGGQAVMSAGMAAMLIVMR